MSRITTALISAAGRGTRMGSLTANQPKHLLPVRGRPFISYLLDTLATAGVERMILVIGHCRHAWTDFLATRSGTLAIVDQFERLGEKYGTACPMEAAAAELAGERFLAVNGDNLYSVNDIRAMLTIDFPNAVAGITHDHPERYGVLVVGPDGRLERIEEKPVAFVGNLINTGLYAFGPEVIPIVRELERSPRGEYEITDAVTRLASEGRVGVVRLQDFWKDFGRPEDIAAMEQFVASREKKS